MNATRTTIATLLVITVGCSGGGGPHPGSGGAGGGGGAGAPPSATPIILSFTATPPTLPAGGGQTSLRWMVENATSLSIDQGVGAVSGTSVGASVTATTIFTLTATNTHGSVTASTAVVIGQNPSTGSDGRYVAMISPTGGESFLAPATLRLVAAGHDPNIDTNSPVDGLGGNAAQVQFFVDDDLVLTMDGANAEYWIFKGFGGSVAAGSHRVWARATYTNPDEVLDSVPMIVNVANPPAYGQTVDLTGDVALSEGGFSLVGTAGSRARLNGHGHKIATGGATTGALTLQFVDVFDLGDESDTSQPGIDVSTSGAVIIEDSTFDSSNTVSISSGGAGTVSVRRNTFRSNMRMPLGQEPGGPSSFSAVHFDGTSSGSKVFAGNNVGAGWVELVNTTGWTVGGDTDADSNVLIGPRVGIYTTGANIQVRRNFSHHVYYGGWSQGSNFEIFDSTASTIEHNVIYGSSWPIRGGGAGLELRFNLVLDAGHEWMQPVPGDSIHHNLFVGGDEDQGGLFVYNDPAVSDAPIVNVFNNTFDGQNGDGILASIRLGDTSGPVTVSSNAFINYPTAPIVSIEGGTLTADYNGFFAAPPGVYSDGRNPAHDIETSDAMLSNPPSALFSLDESTIWTRSTSTAGVLAIYRALYAPRAASPLLGAGDPGTTAGNWIGAIGDGQSAMDRFGTP